MEFKTFSLNNVLVSEVPTQPPQIVQITVVVTMEFMTNMHDIPAGEELLVVGEPLKLQPTKETNKKDLGGPAA